MGDINVRLPVEVIDRMKAHMRGGETYGEFLAATLDFMEGTGSVLPWPRRSLALWRQMRAQGDKVLHEAMKHTEAAGGAGGGAGVVTDKVPGVAGDVAGGIGVPQASFTGHVVQGQEELQS